MRFMFLCIVGVSLLGACATTNTTVASNATAETPALEEATVDEAVTEESAPQEVAEADGDRIICKRTIVTGSRFKKNICRTWSEWQAIEDQSSRSVDTLQRRMRGQVSGN